MSSQVRVCVSGVQGYAGKALLGLIKQHPKLQLAAVLATKEKTHYDKLAVLKEESIPLYSLVEISQQEVFIDVLLLATPPEVSIEVVAYLQGSGIKIIDLSGAFRLPAEEFQGWYGVKHKIPGLLDESCYGLSPWNNQDVNDCQVLANPGCYATCALMPLLPLLRMGVIREDSIVIDAKSGSSGAGKQLSAHLMFSEMAENFFPYKVGDHQHTPEIKNTISQLTNNHCDISFVTHMLPIVRGISMSIYANAAKSFSSDEDISAAIEEAYSIAYEDYPLAKIAKINAGNPEHDAYILSLKSVVGTPYVHIAYFVDNGKIFVFSSIDNLLKGAASQAIENINALYQLPLATGLLAKECVL